MPHGQNLTRVARFLAAVVAGYSAFAAGSQPQPPGLSVAEIADGVFVHQGAHADIDDPARSDSANIGFIVGSECVAVIDTGGSVATGIALRTAIAQHTAVRICYVINTHVHFDHVLGNAAFIDDEPQFVGHENLVQAMGGNREFFAEEFPDELGPGGADHVISPTLTVSGEQTLDLGGRTLSIFAHATAHTDTDVTVYDRKTGTLWTGDLLFMERLPILDGSLKGWLKWMAAARDQDYSRVVPGHGPASAAWPDAANAQEQYLSALLSDGRAAIAEGVFLEDAMESMSRESAAPWQLNARHPRNVSRAYRELEWE